jgi:prepilin-type N-terminal cleavage/methylation domain-containing protein
MVKHLGTRQPPKGLTLVELLVVIAIIAVVAGLTATVVPRVWARSQLTQCTNNAYQIAFALQRHDEQRGNIPGWLNTNPVNSMNTTGTGLCSWPVPLLPFLGRSDLYDTWPKLPNNPTIDLFVCPSNRPDKRITYPVVHYAGNIGATGTAANDGIFLNLTSAASTRLTLDDIADADGTTTTLAFTEKSSFGFSPHSWIYPLNSTPLGSLFGSGTASPPVFGVPQLQPAPPCGSYKSIPTTVINNNAARDFAGSSGHLGGVVAAFCDGHTAFLRNDLQPHVYGQILTPRSRWVPLSPGKNKNVTNVPFLEPWLVTNPQDDNPRLCPSTSKPWIPYLLDEKILKQ